MIGLINLIKNIEDNTKHLLEGLFKIHCNNSRIVEMTTRGLVKAIEGTQDSRALICKCIEIIEYMTITIYIKKIEGHPKQK